MQFDDRLATVLRHRTSGGRAARTQFRQLLDLLGARRGAHEGKLLSSAWLRLGALGESIPPRDRAAMIRDSGWHFRNPELAAHLAEDEPEVAAAALARADLAEEDWEALIPRLPVRARGFLRLRPSLPPRAMRLLERLGIHDRGLPDPGIAAQDAPREREPLELTVPANDLDETIEEPAPSVEEESAIGALVKRIEAFQRARAEGSSGEASPRLPLDDAEDAARPALVGFAFTTDIDGRIDWAEPHVAPMVVGTVLASDNVRAAIKAWRRIIETPVTLRGAPQIAGEWIVDAAPRFTVPGGRFYGMAGKVRRPPAARAAAEENSAHPEADRIRQVLHELRTPVNAIQGFAEIIQQQLFGPAPNTYRALAAAIGVDAARLLAGFDEIDRMVRLESGDARLSTEGANLRQTVERTLKRLEGVMRPRSAKMRLLTSGDGFAVTLGSDDTAQLAWRLLATLAGAMAPGEVIELSLRDERTQVTLAIELPIALAETDDLFTAAAKSQAPAVTAGMFGSGFTLRLARAEADAAGGSLLVNGDALVLSLPALTGTAAGHSEKSAGGAQA